MRGSSPRQSRGIALVLLLLAIGALVAAVLVYGALGTVAKRVDENLGNDKSMKALDEALLRFVMTYQRLPCPASGTARTGIENPQASATDPTVGTATCGSPDGVVPWKTLGLTETDALDPWSRYVSYRVYDGAAGFTVTKGLSLVDCLDEEVPVVYTMSGPAGTCNSNTHENTISDFFASKGLTVNDRGTANTKVAYVLVSHGPSGNGAFFPGASARLAAPNASSMEAFNAASGGTYWIVAPSVPTVAASDAAHFDDIVRYAYAAGVIANARLGGRPWPLFGIFNQGTLGLSAGTFNTNQGSKKVTATEGPVMVKASADVPGRTLCATNEDVQGVTACTGNSGNDYITNSQNENVSFDFRVKRRFLKIKLTDFRNQGGAGNIEQAHFALYNGTNPTPVYSVDKTACGEDSHAVGQFLITPGVDFTRVEVSGGNATADFAVGSIAACKFNDASHPPCTLPEALAGQVPVTPDPDKGGWCP
jgi:hypothetical protein